MKLLSKIYMKLPEKRKFISVVAEKFPVLIVIFLTILLIAAAIFYLSKTQNKSSQQTNTPNPGGTNSFSAVSAVTPRAQVAGKGLFYSSQDTTQTQGFAITDGYLDPHDPKTGDTQTISVRIRNTRLLPVTEVLANIETDHKSESYNLSLLTGTTVDGVWGTSWKVSDTYNQKYIVGLSYKSSSVSGKLKVTL